MLEEIGVPYQAVVLPYGHGMKTPEYLPINPMGEVPTLVHGDAVVTEVAAILAYLADVFPQAGLAPRPDEHAARAAYWRWLFFAAGPMEAAITDQALGVRVQGKQQGFVGYGNAHPASRCARSADAFPGSPARAGSRRRGFPRPARRATRGGVRCGQGRAGPALTARPEDCLQPDRRSGPRKCSSSAALILRTGAGSGFPPRASAIAQGRRSSSVRYSPVRSISCRRR
jgi:hypothetical protein